MNANSPRTLRVLLVEDVPEDATLILRELKDGGYVVESVRTTTADEMRAALDKGPWDIVLCDYQLPKFSGEAALRLFREREREVPFIFVSGTIGEEAAVNAMRSGAQDYVMKDHLARLAPAVERELREAAMRAEARRADALAREAERLYRSVVTGMAEGVLTFDAEGRIIAANPSAERILGRRESDLVGHSVGDLDLRPLRADGTAYPLEELPTTRVLASGLALSDAVIGVHRPGGELRWLNVNCQPLTRAPGSRPYLVVTTCHDITARRQTEEALRSSEERFRQVAENIDEVIWLLDVATERFVYVSPAYRLVWGRTCESLYEAPKSWLDAVHPDDRARVIEAQPRRLTGLYDIEYRIVRPDKQVRWVRSRAFAIRNERGAVYRIAGISTDITEHRNLEERLRQSQKMEAIGQLAGGIAHDFNNLLTIVRMQGDMLLESPGLDASLESGIQQVLDAANRGAALTRQLLTFSRKQIRADERDLDLAELNTTMAKLLSRVLGEHIEMRCRFEEKLPLVHADPGMMEQVLMNLVINARDAMPNGGRLLISGEAVAVDAAYVAGHAAARVGRFVRLSVSDTGCGIPPEILPRIFEPFFTTKEAGSGTGLGLATVFGIVHHHRGWIDVQSLVGAGSTFSVYLPALEKSEVPRPAAAPAAQKRTGRETILVVEDDDIVRALVTTALRREGYTILAAGSGVEALGLWRAHGSRIALLVTDVVLPGEWSGLKLAAELRSENPALKVIYTSGYSSEMNRMNLRVKTGWDFLPKPYDLQQLAAILRRRLDETEDSPPRASASAHGESSG